MPVFFLIRNKSNLFFVKNIKYASFFYQSVKEKLTSGTVLPSNFESFEYVISAYTTDYYCNYIIEIKGSVYMEKPQEFITDVCYCNHEDKLVDRIFVRNSIKKQGSGRNAQ